MSLSTVSGREYWTDDGDAGLVLQAAAADHGVALARGVLSKREHNCTPSCKMRLVLTNRKQLAV